MNFADLIGTAKESGSYAPKLPIGEHVVVISSVTEVKTESKGTLCQVDYKVFSSTNPSISVGDLFGEAMFFEFGVYAKMAQGQVRSLVRAIANLSTSTAPEKVAEAYTQIVGKSQAGEGVKIKIIATKGVSKKGTDFVGLAHFAVAQKPEDIVASREWLVGEARSEKTEPDFLDSLK